MGHNSSLQQKISGEKKILSSIVCSEPFLEHNWCQPHVPLGLLGFPSENWQCYKRQPKGGTT